jgi:hypothetical protein
MAWIKSETQECASKAKSPAGQALTGGATWVRGSAALPAFPPPPPTAPSTYTTPVLCQTSKASSSSHAPRPPLFPPPPSAFYAAAEQHAADLHMI